MSKPRATWRSAWTRFLLCEMRRCRLQSADAVSVGFQKNYRFAIHAARAEERGVPQCLNPKGIPSFSPRLAAQAAYLGSTFKSSTTAKRVLAVFGRAVACCPPQKSRSWLRLSAAQSFIGEFNERVAEVEVRQRKTDSILGFETAKQPLDLFLMSSSNLFQLPDLY